MRARYVSHTCSHSLACYFQYWLPFEAILCRAFQKVTVEIAALIQGDFVCNASETLIQRLQDKYNKLIFEIV